MSLIHHDGTEDPVELPSFDALEKFLDTAQSPLIGSIGVSGHQEFVPFRKTYAFDEEALYRTYKRRLFQALWVELAKLERLPVSKFKFRWGHKDEQGRLLQLVCFSHPVETIEGRILCQLLLNQWEQMQDELADDLAPIEQ